MLTGTDAKVQTRQPSAWLVLVAVVESAETTPSAALQTADLGAVMVVLWVPRPMRQALACLVRETAVRSETLDRRRFPLAAAGGAVLVAPAGITTRHQTKPVAVLVFSPTSRESRVITPAAVLVVWMALLHLAAWAAAETATKQAP